MENAERLIPDSRAVPVPEGASGRPQPGTKPNERRNLPSGQARRAEAHRRVGACAASTLLGCSVGPNYVRPTTESPAAYKEAVPWKPAEPRDQEPRGHWWEVFKDPQLDALVARSRSAIRRSRLPKHACARRGR